MATWTTPTTVVTGDVITAAWGNTYVRDNSQYLYDEKINRDGSKEMTSSLIFPNGQGPKSKATGGSSVLLASIDSSDRAMFGAAGYQAVIMGDAPSYRSAASVLWPLAYLGRQFVSVPFGSGSGMSTATSGSASITHYGATGVLATGATSGSIARVRVAIAPTGANAKMVIWNGVPAFSVTIRQNTASASTQRKLRVGIGVGPYDATDTTAGFGYRIEGNTVYAWSANGTNSESTDITTTLANDGWALSDTLPLSVWMNTAGVYFLVGFTLLATHSTYTPPYPTQVTYAWSARVDNGTDAANVSYDVGAPFVMW